MVDDIRPREPKLPQDQNKNFDIADPPDDRLQFADNEPAFVPPDLVQNEHGFVSASGNNTTEKPPTTPKQSGRFKINWGKISFKHASKKQKIIGGVIIAVLLIAGGGGIYALTKHLNKRETPAPAVQAQKKPEPPKPTTEASKLTGVQVNPDINKRPIVSIQIENSPDARPQSALNQAGVVFEAIAEGGITRFNASFLDNQPDYIGPIRSVRPYYVDMVAPFDPVFVHAGGSADGLAQIRNQGIKDLDHGANGGAFQRVSDRFAPHNLYSSMAELDKVIAQRGYTASNIKSYPRKEEKKGQPVAAGKIDIAMSSALYNVHYDYDPASNTYKRVLGGKPHTDHRSGEQISPKVVVTLSMSYSQNGIYSVYQDTGEGQMYVFQDGQVQQGTWKKAGPKEQFEFIGADGKPLALNAGQTWFTLVKAPNNVTYTP
jgi:hypothetical protein